MLKVFVRKFWPTEAARLDRAENDIIKQLGSRHLIAKTFEQHYA